MHLSNAALYNNSRYSIDTATVGVPVIFRMDEGAGLTTKNAKLPLALGGVLQNGVQWTTDAAPINNYSIISWSTGASGDSIGVTAAGNYSVTVSSPGGCYSQASIDVTLQTCITPYYPPPGGGKITDLIGPELTQLYINQNNLDPDSVADIYNLLSDSVFIEVIVNNGMFDSTLALLQTPPYGMTDTIDNGQNEFIITGKFPIANLTKLDSLPTLINYCRPYYPPVAASGIAYSKGDVSMVSDSARSAFGVSGAGVKIGVISDSYNTIAGNPALANVVNGDLPGTGNAAHPAPVEVLQDYPYGTRTNEGRAMLQIIHDVAPDASLAFRTGFVSAGDFAEAVRELRDANCDIIVDDVTYITEPFFQDGLVARAVNEVRDDSVAYFSAAGNYSSNRMLPYSIRCLHPMDLPVRAHDFGGGDIYQSVNLATGNYTVVLQWNDSIYSLGQLPGAQHDLDIYLTDDAGNILFGFNRKNNWGDPIEVLPFTVSGSGQANIMVVKSWGAGNPEFKYIVFRGEMQIMEYSSTGSATLVGQANAEGAMAVGAVLYTNTPAYGVNPPTPASFSSLGGAPVYGNVRNKPDFMGPNGINTTVSLGGQNIDGDAFPNFFGTSCAAPHAAAMAALVKEGRNKFYSLDIGSGRTANTHAVYGHRHGRSRIRLYKRLWFCADR